MSRTGKIKNFVVGTSSEADVPIIAIDTNESDVPIIAVDTNEADVPIIAFDTNEDTHTVPLVLLDAPLSSRPSQNSPLITVTGLDISRENPTDRA